MHFTILPTLALALALSTIANAGSVVAYFCSAYGNMGVTAVSIRVHYDNESDGCKDLFAYDAETGTILPISGRKRFCGDDGFCATTDPINKPGWHVSADGKDGGEILLDGKDAVLGRADTSHDYSGKTAKTICEKQGISDNPSLSVLIWNSAPKTKCKESEG
jgi:hypothetical protein